MSKGRHVKTGQCRWCWVCRSPGSSLVSAGHGGGQQSDEIQSAPTECWVPCQALVHSIIRQTAESALAGVEVGHPDCLKEASARTLTWTVELGVDCRIWVVHQQLEGRNQEAGVLHPLLGRPQGDGVVAWGSGGVGSV